MTHFEVHPLGPGDLGRAAAIEASAPEAWDEEGLAGELAGTCGRLYGLWAGGRLCGVAVFQKILDEASLLSLTVDPALRRRGWGEALLRACLDRLAREGARICFLEARARNAPAVTLYQKIGFQKVGIRRGFYRRPEDDALLMRLEIGPEGFPLL